MTMNEKCYSNVGILIIVGTHITSLALHKYDLVAPAGVAVNRPQFPSNY